MDKLLFSHRGSEREKKKLKERDRVWPVHHGSSPSSLGLKQHDFCPFYLSPVTHSGVIRSFSVLNVSRRIFRSSKDISWLVRLLTSLSGPRRLNGDVFILLSELKELFVLFFIFYLNRYSRYCSVSVLCICVYMQYLVPLQLLSLPAQHSSLFVCLTPSPPPPLTKLSFNSQLDYCCSALAWMADALAQSNLIKTDRPPPLLRGS